MQITVRKSIIAILLFASVATGLSGSLFAQQITLTLDDALSMALKNNRSLKISSMDINIAEAAVDEAFGNALPSVDVAANFATLLEKPKTPFPDFASMLNNSTYGVLFQEGILPYDESKLLPMETALQSFAQKNNFESSVKVTQILFNSAVFTGIGASEIYLDLAKESYKSSQSKTVLDVKKAFYGAILTRELSEIMHESLENAQENLSNVKALYEQGLASEYEYLQVEVQVENLKPRVKELENSFETAKNMLKVLIGISQDQEVTIKGDLEFNKFNNPGKSELIARCLKSNLDLNTLKIKKKVDEALVTIDRSDYWPTIAAFGEYAYNGSADDYDFATYSSSTIGVSLSLNLFKGGSNTSKVQQSLIALKQTDLQISETEDYLASNMKSQLDDLIKVESQIEALNRNVKLAEKTYDLAQIRYKEGTGTQLEIKNADMELRVARSNRMQAIHDYMVALAELDDLLGTQQK